MFDTDKLLEYNNYSKGTMVLFFVFMLLAPLVNGLGLYLQHDFVLVLIELIAIAYALPMYIMHKFIDQKIAVKLAAKDLGGEDPKVKAKHALIYGAILGAIIGGILIIWSKYIPFGPQTIVLQMPIFSSKGEEVAYWIFWALLWVALAVAEVAFYFMFQACVWNQAWSDFLISGCYALMNWTWLWFVVGNYLWSLGLAAVTFGLGYFFLKRRDSHGGIEVMGLRVGIAFGIIALLVFLNFVYPDVKNPTWYFRADSRNVWKKH